jgi:alpha-L-rhamnosidase
MTKLHALFAIAIMALGCLCGGVSAADNIKASDLRCEYLENPLGIDVEKPRLSWKLESNIRGQKQTTYHLLVASSRDKLDKNVGDLWDSGKVKSGQSLNVEYNGSKLKSRTQYFWKVRVWGDSGWVSTWSGPASWSMGILSQDQWQGQWIQSDLTLFEYQKELKKIPDHDLETEEAMRKRAPDIRKKTAGIKEAPAVWMRKEFKSESGKLRRATLFISGLGLYEAYLNGRKINDHLLTVSPYDFSKTVPYHSHDVTRLVKEGENGLGIILGNGYFNPVIPSLLREYAADFIDTPRLRCELLLEFENGSSRLVPSDLSWKFTTAGPIRFNSIRAGETYDARMELGDWSSATCEEKGWASVQSASAPAGHLRHRTLPPVRVIKTIPAVSVKAHGNGHRFDIGVESTGWARLKIHGKAGQQIVIRYPGANSHTLGRYQSFEYICKGKGEEIYEPRFAFNGYRYVDVQGLDYAPEISDLVGCQVVSDLQTVGSFSCSDERINYLQDVNCRTIQNYVIGTPMDPVREKVNWTQDVQTNFETSAYNFDVRSIYDKWQGDFIDGILDSGYVPTVTPSCFDGPTINGPWWGGMIIFNPWQLYNFYGDKKILSKSYDAMKGHLRYLDSIAKNNVIEWGLGDWMDLASGGRGRPKGTTVAYSSTCAYMMYADILQKTAVILDKKKDTDYFAKRKEEIRTAVNTTFYNDEAGSYDKGSQTSYILALKLNIPPKDNRPRIVESFRKQIAADNDHLSTGFVGTPFLLTLLNEEGLGDLAWKIATQESYPSWYDMIFNKKNTVFKENWQGGLVQMPSLAGPIGAWFYHSLGGIRPETPGFKKIIIRPYTETLDWVKCRYESPYGEIRSDWKKANNALTMDITIPPNTTATIHVPAEAKTDITESQKSIDHAEGVKFLRIENGAAVIQVDSGHYSVLSKYNQEKANKATR